MNRIQERFKVLKAEGKTAFIPYITAGDPTLARTEELVCSLDEAGADIVELGVPFSDPVADGAVNQAAAMRALEHGVTLHDIVAAVGRIRQRSQVPIVLFTYYNPVLVYGIQDFARDAAVAGVDGVLCVDLPPEEAYEYREVLTGQGIDTIFLAAPTSTDARLKLIAEQSTGFVYYVSQMGVTGERARIAESVQGMVAKIRSFGDTPVAVGFGISTPEQAHEIAGYADGVIVGSAIVRLVGKLGDVDSMPGDVAAFVKTLVDGTKSA